MNSAVFTSTLSPALLDWLRGYSKEKGKTKRAILEEALVRYRRQEEKKAFAKSFKRAAKDPEMLIMAEEGLADYLEQIKRLEL
jgi:5'-deoxynucleotidase YfbR-like HD superfamily hydrolase